ncbi:MAG: hypothetical protein COB16_08025 [Rhodobacteraceae bacterium]|nr:MAG: hypothetical protein COB16_08025 [Paracoccaceae bacterium]
MTIPHSLQRAAKNAVESSAILQDPAALRASNRPQLRRYEVASLLPNGNIAETRHIAPALPLFEEAFCAFSRGSLVDTENGPIAVEDLVPGDRLVTHDGSLQTLMWKGSTSLIPARSDNRGRNHKLTSFMADSFGMQKPMSCVTVGPAARLLRTPPHLRAIAGVAPLLTPVQEFQDGMNIVEAAPPTPVQVFHLCLRTHAVIKIGGLEFETYHPGTKALQLISHAMRTLYLNMFNHIDQQSDFGPLAYARAGDGQIDAVPS